MSHIPVSIILRGRRPTGAVCITSSWGVKIDVCVSTAVLHTFHSLEGVDWFIGPSWHLPTSLGRWGGHHVFAVSSGAPLICMSRCWIGDLESQGNFGFFVWKSELSRRVLNNVLPARNWAYLRDVWAISKESCRELQRDAYRLSFWHHWVPLQLFASCPH